MTSSLFQLEASDDNTTTYDYQTDITTTYDYQSDIVTTSANITQDLFINTTDSTLSSNNSCCPNCYTIFKPHRVNVDFIIGITCLFFVVIFVITTSTVVFLRHHQQSKKQQKKEKEYLQDKKLCAHPFEEVLVVVDEPQSIELMEIRPTTPAT